MPAAPPPLPAPPAFVNSSCSRSCCGSKSSCPSPSSSLQGSMGAVGMQVSRTMWQGRGPQSKRAWHTSRGCDAKLAATAQVPLQRLRACGRRRPCASAPACGRRHRAPQAPVGTPCPARSSSRWCPVGTAGGAGTAGNERMLPLLLLAGTAGACHAQQAQHCSTWCSAALPPASSPG